MSNRARFWVAATIIAAIVIIGFIASVPHTRDVPHEESPAPEPVAPAVTLRDSFKKGLHSFTGSVMAPDACSMVTASSSLEGDASTTELVVITLSIPADTGVCLQLPTELGFSTTIAAPSGTSVRVMVNGAEATTTPS